MLKNRLNSNYSMPDENSPPTETNNKLDLTAKVEALLFVSPEPITPYQLGSILDVSTRRIKNCLDKLEGKYQGRGIRLQHHNGAVQLTTAPEAAQLIEHFLEIETTYTLSQAALETLSIVAYQQPVTRPQIDAIRGVNSDSVLRTLLSEGLIKEVGRAESPGRPILYSATSKFLTYFGLSSFEELPPLDIEDLDRGELRDPKVLKN
ncbi:MAG: SMC-Scp complex subunit ScpB [Anaerolineales bacterium]